MATLKLSVNGEERSFPQGLTVAELVRRLEIAGPEVAVEVNRSIVPRSAHAERRLEDGDQVEIVTFVGGG
jgi:sulfur carrier protein